MALYHVTLVGLEDRLIEADEMVIDHKKSLYRLYATGKGLVASIPIGPGFKVVREERHQKTVVDIRVCSDPACAHINRVTRDHVSSAISCMECGKLLQPPPRQHSMIAPE